MPFLNVRITISIFKLLQDKDKSPPPFSLRSIIFEKSSRAIFNGVNLQTEAIHLAVGFHICFGTFNIIRTRWTTVDFLLQHPVAVYFQLRIRPPTCTATSKNNNF